MARIGIDCNVINTRFRYFIGVVCFVWLAFRICIDHKMLNESTGIASAEEVRKIVFGKVNDES